MSSQTHTRTHTRTDTRTHARTQALYCTILQVGQSPTSPSRVTVPDRQSRLSARAPPEKSLDPASARWCRRSTAREGPVPLRARPAVLVPAQPEELHLAPAQPQPLLGLPTATGRRLAPKLTAAGRRRPWPSVRSWPRCFSESQQLLWLNM